MTPTSAAADGLSRYISDWQPEAVDCTDVVTAPRAQALADTLDLADKPAAQDPLPPLWHWVYFPDWPATAELGPDGHPAAGHFLPPIPNRRRMFAGGRVTMTAPLVVGEPANRHSAIADTRVKHGRTGEMLFVTIRHSYRQNGEVRLVEEQDLVYRSDEGATTSFTRIVEPLAEPSTPWTAQPHTHPVLLFRFSALTGNAHRIHYDEPYAVNGEGYPGLVVHGPLLALYMAELVRANSGGRAVAGFEFRLQRPVFVGDEIRVQGAPSNGDGPVELTVVSGRGTTHASANATYA